MAGNTIGRNPYELLTVSRATAVLPQGTTGSIFTISGGRIMLIQIIGEVTTIIETQDNDTQLVANPTTGSSIDLCAVLNITADEVGLLYGITGTVADALVGVNAGLVESQGKSIILPVGTIDLVCAASNSGNVKWDAWYVALDQGATMAAA